MEALLDEDVIEGDASFDGSAADEVAAAFARANVWLARAHVGLAVLSVEDVWADDGSVSPAAWLRSRVGLGRAEAGRAIGLARLVGVAPTLAAAWQDGLLSAGQVGAVRANVDGPTQALFVEHEAGLIAAVVPLDVRGTVQVMQAWKAHADALVERPEPAEAVGVVHHDQLADGSWRLAGTLGAEDGAVVEGALRAAADRPDAVGDRPLTVSQRRAEALVEVCRRYLDGAPARVRRGRRRQPHVHVLLDAAALVDGGRSRLAAGGFLTTSATARLVCDANLHRLVLGTRGEVLDHGRATRTVTAGLWSTLVLRDGGCRHPGCDRPEAWCDAHHVVPFGRGGTTCLANLVLSCRRHHTLAHQPGWAHRLEPDGTLHVTNPMGATHTSHPPGPRPPGPARPPTP